MGSGRAAKGFGPRTATERKRAGRQQGGDIGARAQPADVLFQA
jgi:hypothetical protein